MAAPSDPRTLVLHGLRLKGFGEPPAVAEAVGLEEATVKPHLDALVDEGLVTHREGAVSGFALTPAGRSEHARLLAEELDRHGVRDRIAAGYEAFLPHNRALLEVCTRWQVRVVDGRSVVNDHTDAAYDADVIADLVAVDAAAQPILAELGDALERFAGYGPRLANALARVQGGDVDWFTKPMIASYHTVWFELHEDLLATLGLERGHEEEH